MSGSAVIESPALSLNEHLSGLATRLCWGEQTFHYQIQWRCVDLGFLTIIRRSQSAEWHPCVSLTMFKTSYTVPHSLVAHVALCYQEKPDVPYRRSQSTRRGALLDVPLGWTTLAAEMMRRYITAPCQIRNENELHRMLVDNLPGTISPSCHFQGYLLQLNGYYGHPRSLLGSPLSSLLHEEKQRHRIKARGVSRRL